MFFHTIETDNGKLKLNTSLFLMQVDWNIV